MRAARPLLACVALAAACACSAAMAGSIADVEVYDRTAGRTLPIYEHEGRLYVAGEPRHQYELRVRNSSSARVLAVTSVDGVNVITGETAAQEQSGYVLGRWDSVRIEGWRKSLDEVATFYFTKLADSYAARTGRPHDAGRTTNNLAARVCRTTTQKRRRPRHRSQTPRRPMNWRVSAMPPARIPSAAANPKVRRSSARVTGIAKRRPRST